MNENLILIADSGSTKCDWLLLDINGNYQDSYKTMGFNPFFHSTELIASKIAENQSLKGISQRVRNVYFYGAGCSTPYYNSIVEKALKISFPNAENKVGHDLEGAAYAGYFGEPTIVCILGTGSNSCFFDGKAVHEEVPALGYILGDEGSGSYFGKMLLADYLYKRLPADLHASFFKEYGLDKAAIFQKVYNEPGANVYLAGFTRFLGQYVDHPFIYPKLVDGMRHFLDVHVCCFKNNRNVQINFIGSVAFYFGKALQQACDEMGLRLGHIVKQPIQNLVEYHKKYIINK